MDFKAHSGELTSVKYSKLLLYCQADSK